VPKHALIQAPTLLAHFNDQVWAAEGHPASEFWAYRHVRYHKESGEMEFAMAGGPNDFFPYGKFKEKKKEKKKKKERKMKEKSLPDDRC